MRISSRIAIILLTLLVVTLPLLAACGGDKDADGDGIKDKEDNCVDVANADQVDADGDGIGDACDDCVDVDKDTVCDDVDNCPGKANTDQTDVDSDEIGDACDDCIDVDNDGVCAEDDNCPDTVNADQTDIDMDGIGDACDDCVDVDNDDVCAEDDACPNDPDNDIDGDGICGDVDNCPTAENANQADADGDGIGDGCDNCVDTANANQADLDADGTGDACDDDMDGDDVANAEDNCPKAANADQADEDGDGVGDACAVNVIGTTWTYNVGYANDEKVPDNDSVWTYAVNSDDPVDGVDAFTAEATIEGDPKVGFWVSAMGTAFTVNMTSSSVTRNLDDLSLIMEGFAIDVPSPPMPIVATREINYEGDPGQPYSEGQTWSYSGKIATDMGFDLDFAADVEVVGMEDVTVPAGTFSCYKIEYAFGESTNTEYWSAAGDMLAPVKIVDTSTFMGTQTFEMTSYTAAP